MSFLITTVTKQKELGWCVWWAQMPKQLLLHPLRPPLKLPLLEQQKEPDEAQSPRGLSSEFSCHPATTQVSSRQILDPALGLMSLAVTGQPGSQQVWVKPQQLSSGDVDGGAEPCSCSQNGNTDQRARDKSWTCFPGRGLQRPTLTSSLGLSGLREQRQG